MKKSKLNETELTMLTADLLHDYQAFLDFEKRLDLENKAYKNNLTFDQRLKMFYSVYQTCKVR